MPERLPGRGAVDLGRLELERARRLFRQRGWRMLDVSGRAVEENAARILEFYQASDPQGSAR